MALEPIRAQENQNLIIAQTAATSFSVPDELPEGSAITISGSENAVHISNSLKEKFEDQFSGTTVELNSTDSDSALKAVADKEAELAAISRPLTAAEEAQGFKPVNINREKIAIIVGENNSYNGSLTIEDFAKIFRGEITNWSEVGGAAAPIKLVDRLETNDTRRSFPNYPVFQNAEFTAGANATVYENAEITAIANELGNNGISYAPVSVAKSLTGTKVLKMHKTLPDDPRYPFSQPNLYVYQGELSPAAQGYLGFVTAGAGQTIINQEIVTGQPALDAKLPSVETPEVNVDAPQVDAELPSVEAPDVDVEAPQVNAELPSVEAPDVNVEAPQVNAELPSVEAPDTNAQAPTVESPGAINATQTGSNWWWYLPLLGLIPLTWFLISRGKEGQTVASQTAVRERELVGAGVGGSSSEVEVDNNASGNNFATGAAIATGLGDAAIASRRKKQPNVPDLPDVPDIETPDLPNVGGAVEGLKGKIGDVTPDLKTPDLPDVGGAAEGLKGKIGGAVEGVKGKIGDITPDIKAPDLPDVDGAVEGVKGK
ncbi:MAG: substrate-binding domain-containing protein, partial [Cyanobacteria bacterium P01_F01_bin.143]